MAFSFTSSGVATFLCFKTVTITKQPLYHISQMARNDPFLSATQTPELRMLLGFLAIGIVEIAWLSLTP